MFVFMLFLFCFRICVVCVSWTECRHRPIARLMSCPPTHHTLCSPKHNDILVSHTCTHPIPNIAIGPRSLSQAQNTGGEEPHRPDRRRPRLCPLPTTTTRTRQTRRIPMWRRNRRDTPPHRPGHARLCPPPIPTPSIVHRTCSHHRFRRGNSAARMPWWLPLPLPSVQRSASWNVTAGRMSRRETVLSATPMHPRPRRCRPARREPPLWRRHPHSPT